MIKQVINQDIWITDKAYKKHGCGRIVWFVEIFVYPGLSNTKESHLLFEPITQMEDIV